MNPISSTVNRAALQTQVTNVESQQEAIRNQREAARAGFQGASQHANQALDQLLAILKAQAALRSVGASGRSGL